MDAGRSQQRPLETPQSKTTTTARPAGSPAVAEAPARASGDQAVTQAPPLSQTRGQQPAPRTGQQQPALQNQAATAQQNRGKILTDPKEIFQHELSRNPKAQENFARLSPEQQAAFQRLTQGQVVPGTKVSTAPPPAMGSGMGMGMGMGMEGVFGAATAPGSDPKAKLSDKDTKALQEQMGSTGARMGLVNLLASGKLTSTDASGKTLLSQLERLQQQPLAPGMDRNALLRGAINDINMPYMPPSQGSVATGELQRKMASEKPADYIRTVADLATPDGSSQIGSFPLKRGETTAAFQSASSSLFRGAVSDGVAREQLFQLEFSGKPEHRQQFAALPPVEQRRLKTLYNAAIPTGEVPAHTIRKDFANPTKAELEAEAAAQSRFQTIQQGQSNRSSLMQLLQDGKLAQTDTQGKTLLANLDSLRTQTFARDGQHRLDGAQVYSEVLKQTAEPGNINQGARGTCTVTTMEHLQASREPAEYVRVMAGLTSAGGSVKLRNGETLTRDSGLVAPDDSGRTSASRVYQASMMEYANGANDYRNDQGGHFTPDGKPILDDRGKLTQGLPMHQLARVSSAVLGGDFEERKGTMQGANAQSITADITKAIAEDRPVEVGMRWSRNPNDRDTYHALSVYKVEGDYVYLRNPWGAGEQGHKDASTGVVREALRPEAGAQGGFFGGGFGGFTSHGPAVDPKLPVGEAGTLRMKKSDFFANLDSYVVQKPEAAPVIWWNPTTWF